MTNLGTLKTLARDTIEFGLSRAGFTESEDRLDADAQAYWRTTGSDAWRGNSHWRGGLPDGQWHAVGGDHLALYRKMSGGDPRGGHVLGWGCGGGANAVAFAPLADRFTGVEVAAESLDECARQVKAACDTPFTPVLIDVADPELAEAGIAPVDLFLCLYVLELVPSPEYGLRLMRVAHRLLKPGGEAFVQIKYQTGWRTQPRRRRYRESTAASMTTYRVGEFRQAMQSMGFQVEAVELVPHTGLDGPYAYLLLRKPTAV